MSARSPHIVGKVNLDFDLADSNDVFTVTDKLKEQTISNIRKVIERIPDLETRTIRIDHIDLNFELQKIQEFSDAFELTFEKQLQHLIEDNLNKGLTAQNDSVDGGSSSIGNWENFLFYLKNGCLPWNTSNNEQLNLDQVLSYFRDNQELCSNELTGLFIEIQALNRFCFELPFRFLDNFLKLSSDHMSEKYRVFFSQFDTLFQVFISDKTKGFSSKTFRRMVLSVMLQHEVQQADLPSKKVMVEEFILMLFKYRNEDINIKKVWTSLERSISRMLRDDIKVQKSGSNQLTGDAQQNLFQTALHLQEKGEIHFSYKNKIFRKTDKVASGLPKGQETDSSLAVSREVESEFEEDQSDFSQKESPPEGLYINNAGLVLMHPFLLPLFQELKLCNHQGFYNNHLRNRAAHILQTLVGFDAGNYKGLAFNKVLCGIEITDVLHGQFRISRKVRNECNQVLNSVIRNWSILKSTSIEGLQEGFLQREGILEFKDHRYKLIVERKSQDILLEHLPWQIGVIKLPWNKHLIMVDW